MSDWTYGAATLYQVSSILDIRYERLYDFLLKAGVCDVKGHRNEQLSSRKLMDCLIIGVLILYTNSRTSKSKGGLEIE